MRRHNAEQRATQAGFTAIELLVVLAIISIVGLTSSLVFGTLMQAFTLHGAANEVLSRLQDARMTAVMTNARHRVVTASTGRLKLQRYDDSTNQWSDVHSADAWPREDATVTVVGTDAIVFAPNGTAPSYGSINVVSAGGSARTVSVTLSGSVHLN